MSVQAENLFFGCIYCKSLYHLCTSELYDGTHIWNRCADCCTLHTSPHCWVSPYMQNSNRIQSLEIYQLNCVTIRNNTSESILTCMYISTHVHLPKYLHSVCIYTYMRKYAHDLDTTYIHILKQTWWDVNWPLKSNNSYSISCAVVPQKSKAHNRWNFFSELKIK